MGKVSPHQRGVYPYTQRRVMEGMKNSLDGILIWSYEVGTIWEVLLVSEMTQWMTNSLRAHGQFSV